MTNDSVEQDDRIIGMQGLGSDNEKRGGDDMSLGALQGLLCYETLGRVWAGHRWGLVQSGVR